jgi:hypothetical protein
VDVILLIVTIIISIAIIIIFLSWLHRCLLIVIVKRWLSL